MHTFYIAFILFLLLYFFFATTALFISKFIQTRYKLNGQENYDSLQIGREIKFSIVSIFVFALQAIFIQVAYVRGWIDINWQVNVFTLIPQIIVLFFWNELHFYLCHRLLHAGWWYRKVHKIHHTSFHPSPFSVYSFHWIEAFLLGTVIFLPLLLYPFQYLALLSLPVMSIFLNTLGHWDYDLFPHLKPSSLLKFSYRHAMHHRKVHGNFGFLLPIFDRIFKTGIK
jgi:sterol desaturase/sphingolipid hydroxylase (fatty acid hydroxylase superfamily)